MHHHQLRVLAEDIAQIAHKHTKNAHYERALEDIDAAWWNEDHGWHSVCLNLLANLTCQVKEWAKRVDRPNQIGTYRAPGMWSGENLVYVDVPIYGTRLRYLSAIDETRHQVLVEGLSDNGLIWINIPESDVTLFEGKRA